MAAPADRAIDLAVDALAAYRLTKLATDDAITEDPRRWLVERSYRWSYRVLPVGSEGAPTAVDLVSLDDDPPKLAILLTCRWCMGVWVAAGVTAARLAAPATWRVAARGLAVSAAAALIAGLEAD